MLSFAFFPRTGVRFVLLWLAAWGLASLIPFLCFWSALMDRISVLECAFWGFLLLFALLHLFPLLRLFVTR